MMRALLLAQMRSRVRSPLRSIEAYQQRKLREIIRHAYDNVPYYRRIFEERHLTPDDIRSPADLAKLPVLEKMTLYEHQKEFIAEGTNLARCREHMTTGTTGLQVHTYFDRIAQAYNDAANFRSLLENGMRLTDKVFELSQEKNWPKRKPLMERFGILRKERGPFTDAPEKLIARINTAKPDILMGPPPSLLILAEYAREKGVSLHQPRLIFTSATMLPRAWRKTISGAFGCDIRDLYGSTEFRRLAWECEKHEGYHTDIDYAIIEILPDSTDDQDVGAIVVTGLHNKAMPLIRYRLGDIVRRSHKACSCGRTLPLIDSIEGRFEDIVRLPSGRRLIIPNFSPLYTIPFVQQFQIVQVSEKEILANVLPTKKLSAAEKRRLQEGLRRSCFGEKLRYSVRIISELPLDKSGKFRMLISRVKG